MCVDMKKETGKMYLKQDDQIIPILVEDEAWPGVKRIV